MNATSKRYRINEIFYSLQGEGFWTGTPAVFVRFSGCNLRCPFCDTDFSSFTELSASEVLAAAAALIAPVGQKRCLRTPHPSDAPAPPNVSFVLSEEESRQASLSSSLPAKNLSPSGPSPCPCPGVDTPSASLPPSEPAAAAALEAGWGEVGETHAVRQRTACEEISPSRDWVSTASPRRLEATARVIFTGGEPGLQLDAELVEVFHRAGYAVHVETNGTQPLPEGIDWVTLSPKAVRPVLGRADEIKVVFAEGDDPSPWAEFPATWHFLQPCDISGDAAATRRNTAAAIHYCQAHPLWRLSLQTHKLLGIR